jgi:uncharacterized protein YjiK
MAKAVLSLILISCVACTYYDHSFPYDFEKGITVTPLDESLDEISALCYESDTLLYSVQDEKGIIFSVNLKSGKVREYLHFKKKGDFEGLAKHEDNFYALESNGDIYELTSGGGVQKYTFFDKAKGFEFEGICIAPNRDNLLIACKHHKGKEDDKYIYVYTFSLKDKRYQPRPFLRVEKLNIHEQFASSGIAVNPVGNIVLLSAKTFTIAELNTAGQLIRKAQLPFIIYPQVEGICYSPEGVLYLASERGEGMNGKIIQLRKNEK